MKESLDNGKFEKSLEPSNVPSESIEKAKEVYIDKNVTECQPPEMNICYEENGFNVVKDICVDEGLPHEEIIKCDKEHGDMIKDDLNKQLIVSVTEDDNVPSNDASEKMTLLVESSIIGHDTPMQNGEEKLDPNSNLMNNSVRVLGEEKLDSSSDLLNNSIGVHEPVDYGFNDVDQHLSEQSTGSEANEPRETTHITDIPNEIQMEEITTLSSDNVKPATASGPHELVLNTESAHNVALNNIAVAPRGGGESSFSVADPVSGHITYFGPVTSAGSLSHRSDGSNTSVRSFAFPILQNEWNSSPVRMAKVDPKQSPKHGGWRQALMCCCRF